MTTPGEQLAKLIFIADNLYIPTNTLETDWETGDPEIVDYAYKIADAIIQAGWTPPPSTPA